MKNYQLVKVEIIEEVNEPRHILLHDMRFNVKVKLIKNPTGPSVSTATLYLALRGFTIEGITYDDVNKTNYLLLSDFKPISSNLISVNHKKMQAMELK